MDNSQFVASSEPAARRISRRAAVRAGGGLVAALGAAKSHLAAAQDESGGEPPELLFVQAFGGGSLGPAAGTAGGLALTLDGAADRTIFFADRPERLAGFAPTADVLAALAATAEDPPNAALVARPATSTSASGLEDAVWVVTLLSGEYDAENGTLTYDVRVLEAETAARFGVTQAMPPTERQEFGAGHLFIDGEPSFPVDNPNGKNLSFHSRGGTID